MGLRTVPVTDMGGTNHIGTCHRAEPPTGIVNSPGTRPQQYYYGAVKGSRWDNGATALTIARQAVDRPRSTSDMINVSVAVV